MFDSYTTTTTTEGRKEVGRKQMERQRKRYTGGEMYVLVGTKKEQSTLCVMCNVYVCMYIYICDATTNERKKQKAGRPKKIRRRERRRLQI